MGVYDSGQIKCECFGHLDELSRDPVTKKPKCSDEGEKCPVGTALRGFEASGAPICEIVVDGYDCDVTVPVSADGHADCGPKYRLRAITDPGNCYVEPTGGADDDDGIVRCPGISIHCCRLKVANE